MKVIITFTCCCDNLWKSKFMALEKPGKLSEFFSPTLLPPCFSTTSTTTWLFLNIRLIVVLPKVSVCKLLIVAELDLFLDRMPFLTSNYQCQSTGGLIFNFIVNY